MKLRRFYSAYPGFISPTAKVLELFPGHLGRLRFPFLDAIKSNSKHFTCQLLSIQKHISQPCNSIGVTMK